MERTPYWLIQNGVFIDLLAFPAMVVFGYGVYLHWRRIKKGETRLRISLDDLRMFFTRAKLRAVLWNGLLGARVYRRPITGFFHGLVFWGMLLLLLGTTMVLLNVVFGLGVMSGPFYQWFMVFALDAAGLAVLVGIGFLLARRLTQYPRLWQPKPRAGFILAELLIAAVVLTGFILEGQRLRLSGAQENAFIGNLMALAMGGAGGSENVYIAMWWFHGLLALGLIAYIPFSPLVHMLFIPVNAAVGESILGADDKALDVAALEPDADGNMPPLGTPTLAHYPAKRLLDFSTCLWCGRCQEVCPAAVTEKSLTPKGVILTLAEALAQGKMSDHNLVDAVGMQTLFECRTCGACVETCPAMINPLKTIWSMRQNLMMERGEMPSHMLQAYRNMEALMQPFSSQASPSEWRKGLEVPKFHPGQTEYLLWIGCAVTYEDRAQQVGRAMVRVLNAAGVSYGIIEDARCTGDPAKQMGDDYLFATLANANIQLFSEHGVQKIITLCPHCFNSFKNYYPPLGAAYEVIPHASLINELIRSGKLNPSRSIMKKIAYHDPCYLGRHNRVFEPPRQVVEALGTIAELPRHHGDSFCCGAGGGNYWNEEEGKRINYARAEEAFQSGADLLASSCPFCLLMLTDGMKMYTEKKMVFDVAELVAEDLEARGGAESTTSSVPGVTQAVG
jgi:Fe-S oxidoreductase/nitrate reductase gamma subunit